MGLWSCHPTCGLQGRTLPGAVMALCLPSVGISTCEAGTGSCQHRAPLSKCLLDRSPREMRRVWVSPRAATGVQQKRFFINIKKTPNNRQRLWRKSEEPKRGMVQPLSRAQGSNGASLVAGQPCSSNIRMHRTATQNSLYPVSAW